MYLSNDLMCQNNAYFFSRTLSKPCCNSQKKVLIENPPLSHCTSLPAISFVLPSLPSKSPLLLPFTHLSLLSSTVHQSHPLYSFTFPSPTPFSFFSPFFPPVLDESLVSLTLLFIPLFFITFLHLSHIHIFS